MSLDMNRLDNEEQAIHAALSQIKVDTAKIAQGVRNALHEDNEQVIRTQHVFRKRRLAPLIAAIVAVIVFSTSALAYTLGGFEWFIELVNPPFAEIVEPAMVYSEDQGIRLTVLGAQTFDNTSIVYLSLEDITGQNRLTESVFVMGDLMIPFDESTAESEEVTMRFAFGNTNLLYFDEATGIAYFEVRYTSSETIPNPLTFRTNEITFAQDHIENEPIPVSLADLAVPETILVMLGDHMSSSIRREVHQDPIQFEILLPGMFAQFPGYPEGDGNWISNMGIVDGQLRVQTIQDMSSRFGGIGVALSLVRSDGEIIHPSETLWGRAWEDHMPLPFMEASREINVSGEFRMAPYSISEYIFDVDLDNLDDYQLMFFGSVVTGVEGHWEVSVNTSDTANQIITIMDDILIMGHTVEFITLNPIGMQVRGRFDNDTNIWGGGSGEHGEFIAYVETSDGNVLLKSSGRGYVNAFSDRYDSEPLGGYFDWSWQTESPLDISTVTAIIIEGVRIPV